MPTWKIKNESQQSILKCRSHTVQSVIYIVSPAFNILLAFEDRRPIEGVFYLLESIYIIAAGWNVENSQFSSQFVLMISESWPSTVL